MAERAGRASWRIRIGGVELAERVGGVELAESSWRSHHSADSTQDACLFVDEISVGLKLALSEWRSGLAERAGGVGLAESDWRSRIGGASWRSRVGGVGLAESDWRSHHSAHDT